MLKVEACGSALKLVVTDKAVRKEFDISNLSGEALEAVMIKALDLNQYLSHKHEVSVVDVLFKDGTPLYIYLQNNAVGGLSFHLRINRNPITGSVLPTTIAASASIGRKFTFEQAFEVVWSKLALSFGLLEVEIAQPLKWVMLSHFRQQKLYKK